MTVYNARSSGSAARSRRCSRCDHINPASYLACQSCGAVLSGSEWVDSPSARAAGSRNEAFPGRRDKTFEPVQHGGETESSERPAFFNNRNTGALNRSGPFANLNTATEDPEETRESPSVRTNGRETLEAPVINLREESGPLRRAREETIVTRVRPQPTRPSEGSPVFEPTMMLCLEIGEARTPLVMRLPQRRPLVFGRDDPASGERPDIDLIPYGGFQRGISRRHSALELSGKLLSIKDLKSSNGTLLNGVRLDPHERYQLRDGDVLQMGQMTLRIAFKQ